MHTHFLKAALEEARKREGFTAPNPAVGAVLVRKGAIISRGYHLKPGEAHAEVEALKNITPSNTEDATLYVTLEPCCHQGRTGPCTDFILKKGVKNVVFAFKDPNPVVSGKGQQKLKENGVECTHMELAEINAFYRPYQYWWKTGNPFITSKLAMSLDGKIAGPASEPVAITGEKARAWTHALRLQVDGILTTAETVIQDDPRLNVRLTTGEIAKRLFILDSKARISSDAKVLQSKVVLFHSSEAKEENLNVLRDKGVKTVRTPSHGGLLDLKFVTEYLGKEERLYHVLAEMGGKGLLGLYQAKVLSRVFFLVAPKWLGRKSLSAFDTLPEGFLDEAELTWNSLGQDALLEIQWK